MKKVLFGDYNMAIRLLGVFLLCASSILLHEVASSGDYAEGKRNMNNGAESRLRLSFGGQEAVVIMYDHPTTRDLLSRLPLTLDFQDYIGKEKISYLDRKLTNDGSSAVQRGDFAYYAPWGNIAIFYRGSGSAGSGLIVLGTIETGKDALSAMGSNFQMTLELLP